jgi:ubiquinone/menaquinone biosynthesis C-methylase UbiE
MNADEMADNPQLQAFVVQNLNVDPHLPFEAEAFDAAICTVSVQYLTQPIDVFRDLFRVLRPSGVAIFTFSNRCFPTKAVAVWQTSSMEDRAAIVSSYLHDAGFVEIRSADRSPTAKFSLFGNAGDPLVGVWGYKPTVAG